MYVYVEFILCYGRRVSVIKYNVVGDECELKQTQTFEIGDAYTNLDYNGNCGMCIVNSLSENASDLFMSNEVKSENDNLNGNMNEDETCNIVLFGNSRCDDFASSLQWLSLRAVNNVNNDSSYDISIDTKKTKQFQKTFIDQNTIGNREYHSFGYLKWKHFLILFGGRIGNQDVIDSIFYFDFFQMKWYKSLKVM